MEAWKIVAPDFTSRSGRYTWPFPGNEVIATAPDPSNTSPCPSHEGDGLCLAKTVRGASSGRQPLSNAVGLLISYLPGDVLGEDDNKIRVARCRVTGVFDPIKLIRLGLQTNLRGANLRGADLHGANLHGADLHGADLHGANLRGANLSGADLTGAGLYGVYLCGADLTGADLSRADLCGANLSGADLSGADLTGADLTDVRGYTP